MKYYFNKKTRNRKNKKEKILISTIISNYSQCGLLLLAIFGYFYTVRPIYQNQRLSEENAMIKEENENYIKQKEEIRTQFEIDFNSYKLKINQLNDSLKNKEMALQIAETKLEKIYQEKKEAIKNSIERSNALHRKSLIYDLNEEILLISTSRYKKYFGKDCEENFFDQIKEIEYLDIDEYIDQVYDNPVNYFYKTLNILINKYKSIDNDDSKYKTAALLKIEKEARTNKNTYSLPDEKITNIKIRCRYYIKENDKNKNIFGVTKDYIYEYELISALIHDIFSLSQDLDDTEEILDKILETSLSYKGLYN